MKGVLGNTDSYLPTLDYGDPFTGLGVGVYHDYISGGNLLTFNGTDPKNWLDWYNNIKQALDPPAPLYTEAMGIARDLRLAWNKRANPTPAVLTPTTPGGWLITGHSLGGGLAAAASVVSYFDAMTFNAPLSRSPTPKPRRSSNAMHYRDRDLGYGSWAL